MCALLGGDFFWEAVMQAPRQCPAASRDRVQGQSEGAGWKPDTFSGSGCAWSLLSYRAQMLTRLHLCCCEGIDWDRNPRTSLDRWACQRAWLAMVQRTRQGSATCKTACTPAVRLPKGWQAAAAASLFGLRHESFLDQFRANC